LNVTQQVIMPAIQVREQFTAPLLRPVLDMAEVWFSGFYPFVTFHDPLAAATIFKSDICAYQQGTVTIETSDGQARTIWEPGGIADPHQVAMMVDVEGYFEHFFGVIGKGQGNSDE
jgi:inosine-uridine nucleoside N-ribohydrolase